MKTRRDTPHASGGTAPLDIARPLTTVDVIAFTVRDAAATPRLEVLLVRRPDEAHDPFPGRWALPGGFVDVERDATLVDCARRKLAQKTGVEAPYLEQLGSWGSAARDPRGWSATHAYLALIAPPQVNASTVARTANDAAWFDADDAARKRLAFDHADILAAALTRLRGKVEYTSLPAFLIAEPFTLPALQQVYEVVLGRPLDKSAFRKRMLDGGFLVEDVVIAGDAGRPAQGWRIRDRDRATLFPRSFKSGE
jgi:8-oxo-dGTP diphosphatase